MATRRDEPALHVNRVECPGSDRRTGWDRFARSFELVGQSFRLLMQDKELMVLPLVSGLVTAVVVATFFVGFGLSFALMAHPQPLIALPIFLMYVATYFVGIFFTPP